MEKLWNVANELVSDLEAELSSGERGGNLRMPVCYLGPLPTGLLNLSSSRIGAKQVCRKICQRMGSLGKDKSQT
ncbi:hypothetical protein ACS0TY_015523 [Phlomoides rotata]